MGRGEDDRESELRRARAPAPGGERGRRPSPRSSAPLRPLGSHQQLPRRRRRGNCGARSLPSRRWWRRAALRRQVLAVVASAASIAAQHAKELGIPPGVAIAIGIVAAGAALCCGNASGLLHVSDAVKSVACDAKLVAGIAAGAANCGTGATSIGKGAYDKDAQNALADARFSSGQQDVTNFDIDDAIKVALRVAGSTHDVIDTYTQGSKSDQASCSLVLNNSQVRHDHQRYWQQRGASGRRGSRRPFRGYFKRRRRAGDVGAEDAAVSARRGSRRARSGSRRLPACLNQ